MDALYITLIASALMFVVAFPTYLLYVLVRRSSASGSSSDPYLCGEGVEDFKNSISVGSSNFFWGSTSANLKKFYSVLRDSIHSGVLNDWLFYMGIWLSLGVLLSFIVISAGGRL